MIIWVAITMPDATAAARKEFYMSPESSTTHDVLASGRDRPRRRRGTVPPLMPEFAIVSTLVLVAAPVVVVGGAVWMAIKKRVSRSSRTAARTGGVSLLGRRESGR